MGNFKQKLAEFNTPPYRPLSEGASSIFVFLLVFNFYFFSYGLEQIVTPDEFAWVIQSIHFRQALIEQDWPRMVQSAHPGFVTMWLGSISTTIRLWVQPELQAEINWVLQQSWRLPQTGELSARLHPFLQPMRNTLSLFMAGLWTAVYALLKQRTKPLTAFFAIFILISDMWIVGLTNILHVDGLLAMFCLLTLLLVLPRRDDELTFYSRLRYLLLGLTMAGAILSKVPGLLLIVFIPIILLVQWRLLGYANKTAGANGSRAKLAPKNKSVSRPRLPLPELFSVLVGLFATLALFAPIIFIDPNYVFQNVFVLSAREVGFAASTFFLGQVTENPGILFYPLTILFRQRAFITIGLIIAGVQLFRTKNGRNQWFFISAVGAFCILFWLGLLVSDREFARYALPIYLQVALIGAIQITQFASDHISKLSKNNRRLRQIALFPIVVVLFGAIFLFAKDPFEFINPLVGGPWNGKNLMLTGWGGAQSFAVKKLPPGFYRDSGTILFTDNVPATAPFLFREKDVVLLTPETAWLIEPNDAVILSLEHKQLNRYFWEAAGAGVAGREEVGDWPPLFYRIPADKEPDYVISGIGGERASVFSNFDQSLLDHRLSRYKSDGFSFDNGLSLIESTVIKPDDEFNIHLLLRWRHTQPEDGILQFSIADSAGNVWVQREDSLADIEDILARRWTEFNGMENFSRSNFSIHTLPLASDMPPGDYSVRVSHFRPDGSLSGIHDTDGSFIGVNASLATFPVTVPSPQPPVAFPEQTFDDDSIVAIADLPEKMGQGETLSADVWVKQNQAFQGQTTLDLEIGDQTLNFPLDTQKWQAGFTYRIRAKWQIPADFPPTDHPIRLNNIDMGVLTIEPRERNFDIPDTFTAERFLFGDVLKLIVVEPNLNEQDSVRIVWQAINPNQIDYTTFIHLKDKDGKIVAQQDLQPGKPTGQTITGEVVDFTVEIPLENIDPTDLATIAIGFYDPTTGQRLTTLNESGEQLPNNQVEITIGESAN